MQKPEKEKILYKAVLVFFIDPKTNKILLAIHLKHIGEGKYNSYGGGIEPGETERRACVREVKEESGGMTVCKDDLQKRADAYFTNTTEDGKSFVCHVAVFVTYTWKGKARTTEEMAHPEWFKLSNLPVNNMMPADPFWLPLIYYRRKIIVKAKYGPRQAYLIGPVEIEEVEVLTEG
ncbi:MAG: NUDIX domain-containing protein [Minisyncoccia bacterium]